MRVISQCGTMDLPYELIAFSTGYNGNKSENYIFVHSTIFGTDKGTIVAKYSTEEKVRKAMNLLHETYIGKKIFSVNADMDFHESAKELLKNTSIICTPCADLNLLDNGGGVVFKFPKDEEIEVVD